MKQKNPRIGVVLSSGGVRGVYAHTGFLLALERLCTPIAASAGCSAGAVVGGVAASGGDLPGGGLRVRPWRRQRPARGAEGGAAVGAE